MTTIGAARYPEFRDTVVLVTGAASGIGLETASQFAANGARVIAVDCDGDGLQRTADVLGGNCEPISCDVADAARVQGLCEQVQTRFGRLDSLVNNAGVGRLCALDSIQDEDFLYHYGVNVKGPMLLVASLLGLLRQSSYPSIVNVSSCAARGEFMAHHSLYSSSKAALLKYTMHMVRDLPGIRTNAILPGWVDTPIYERAGFERSVIEDLYAQVMRTIPAGRIGRPEDIANCILFLCSQQAAYVNGAALDVHGGLLAGGDWGFPF